MMVLKTKIAHLKNLIIEIILRLKNRSNIFKFENSDSEITLFLPNWGDYLQQHWIVRKTFTEESYLKEISRYIPKNSVILDIGSNIGNHVIYFEKILGAKKVYCFEPHPEIFKILKKNIELNNLIEKTVLNNFGLGKNNSRGEIVIDGIRKGFSAWYKRNLGGTSIRESEKGNIEIRKLDSLKIKEKVDFIKIDTEGFETEVLEGAEKFLKKNKPVIYVEIENGNKEKVISFLEKFGYLLSEEFPDRNYLFLIPSEKSFLGKIKDE